MYVVLQCGLKMQCYKNEFSALYEMQNARSRCVPTVGDCSKRTDCKRRMHVMRNQCSMDEGCTSQCWVQRSSLRLRQAEGDEVSNVRRILLSGDKCMNTAILNWMRYFTGSQWSSRTAAVMCDRRSSHRTRRAAAFCTRWSGAMVDWAMVVELSIICKQVSVHAAIWFQAVFSHTTNQENQSCMHPPWWLPSIQIRIEWLVGYRCYTTSTLLG